MERLTDKHFNKTLGYYMKCSGCCERSIACNECEEFEALAKNTHFDNEMTDLQSTVSIFVSNYESLVRK